MVNAAFGRAAGGQPRNRHREREQHVEPQRGFTPQRAAAAQRLELKLRPAGVIAQFRAQPIVSRAVAAVAGVAQAQVAGAVEPQVGVQPELVAVHVRAGGELLFGVPAVAACEGSGAGGAGAEHQPVALQVAAAAGEPVVAFAQLGHAGEREVAQVAVELEVPGLLALVPAAQVGVFAQLPAPVDAGAPQRPGGEAEAGLPGAVARAGGRGVAGDVPLGVPQGAPQPQVAGQLHAEVRPGQPRVLPVAGESAIGADELAAEVEAAAHDIGRQPVAFTALAARALAVVILAGAKFAGEFHAFCRGGLHREARKRAVRGAAVQVGGRIQFLAA